MISLIKNTLLVVGLVCLNGVSMQAASTSQNPATLKSGNFTTFEEFRDFLFSDTVCKNKFIALNDDFKKVFIQGCVFLCRGTWADATPEKKKEVLRSIWSNEQEANRFWDWCLPVMFLYAAERKTFATVKAIGDLNVHWVRSYGQNNGRTALHIVAANGAIEIIEYLLSKDMSILDAQDVNGDTALYLAVEFGQIEAARLLLEKGARFDFKNRHGEGIVEKIKKFHGKNPTLPHIVKELYALFHVSQEVSLAEVAGQTISGQRRDDEGGAHVDLMNTEGGVHEKGADERDDSVDADHENASDGEGNVDEDQRHSDEEGDDVVDDFDEQGEKRIKPEGSGFRRVGFYGAGAISFASLAYDYSRFTGNEEGKSKLRLYGESFIKHPKKRFLALSPLIATFIAHYFEYI